METWTLKTRNQSLHSESLRAPGFPWPAHAGKPVGLAQWRWVRLPQAGFGLFALNTELDTSCGDGRKVLTTESSPPQRAQHGLAAQERGVFQGVAWSPRCLSILYPGLSGWCDRVSSEAESFCSPCLVADAFPAAWLPGGRFQL